jgi:hypothetical protein
MEFPIEKRGQTKVVTKQHHDDDEIVDNNHQVLVFKTIFRIRENHQFQLLQNPQRTNGFMKEPANN